ncbi:Hypothetical predicted protein [Marmota monax]|uniref:Uncharacterized protein n=1 Tax=Marmota monax TaxID=9995 RepID=A0A5E4BPK4_MARMO|nr:hypothetical protein GHT09_006844 [Marmota monax]VTJ70990.1 Hypothetical predicted protein [Marmota monax]
MLYPRGVRTPGSLDPDPAPVSLSFWPSLHLPPSLPSVRLSLFLASPPFFPPASRYPYLCIPPSSSGPSPPGHHPFLYLALAPYSRALLPTPLLLGPSPITPHLGTQWSPSRTPLLPGI